MGDIFEQAAISADKSEKEIVRAPQLPLRAPMVIVAIAKFTKHEKVPWVEQVASASCALQAMQMAAVAQGYGGVWRTGSYAQCNVVKSALGIAEHDELIGFLYLGSLCFASKPKTEHSPNQYFRRLT